MRANTESHEGKEGYVYILVNPSLRDDMLKIGMTTRFPEVRAKELSSGSGVVHEYVVAYKKKVFDCRLVEHLTHKYLDRFRVNDKREFFKLPLASAITIVRRMADRASSLEAWEGEHVLKEGSIAYWSCQAGNYILFLRYENPFMFDARPEVIDVWEARDDGDQIVIVSKDCDDPTELSSDGSLSAEFDLRPGDRVAWVGKNRGAVSMNDKPINLCAAECQAFAKAYGYSVSPRTNGIGLPILLSDLSSDDSPPYLQDIYRTISEMGVPQTWG